MRTVIALVAAAASASAAASAAAGGGSIPFTDAAGGGNIPFEYPNMNGLPPFAAARFGLFVHVGAINQWGTEISFPLVCTGFPCTTSGAGKETIVIENATALAAHRQAYADLAQTYNPSQFNAEALADLAYAAGFRYLTWVATHVRAIHIYSLPSRLRLLHNPHSTLTSPPASPCPSQCDGYSNWNSTNNRAYSVVTSPFGRDTGGEMIAAFRAKGIRAGVYICPSIWNMDTYWAPSALTSFGDCCSPNYPPALNTTTQGQWSTFVDYLKGESLDIAARYSPSHYWYDSGTYPTAIDTHLEQIIPALRAANPEVVVQVRDGGIHHDYTETVDHSEDDAHDIMGFSYIRPMVLGDTWEVPGTLGEQWAWDPDAAYEGPDVVVSKLVGVAAKNGNFLLNIGLDPTGQWAPEAVSILQNLSLWMAFNGESIYNTTAAYPYEYHPTSDVANQASVGQFFVNSNLRPSTYITLLEDTGASISSTSLITIPFLKPSTLTALPVAIVKLTSTGDVPLAGYVFDETGLNFNASDILVPSPVLLGTYRHNYTFDEDPVAVRRRNGRKEEWPQTWWKRGMGKKGGSASISANGAASPSRRTRGSGRGSSVRPSLGPILPLQATGSSTYSRTLLSATQGPRTGASSVVDNAPCGTRGCSVYTSAGYSLIRNEGVCYRSSLLPNGEAAVPVNLFYNGGDDNMGATTAPNDSQSWQDVDIECWAYASAGPTPGARQPLEVWHSEALGDYWTLADPASRAEAQAQGYVKVSTVGYVEPAPAGGQLPPADLALSVASWGYVLRLDWA
jgi:alpha-L-fucosidase